MFEKTALHVLFPLSWVMLIMALTDAAKDHFRTYGMPEMLIVLNEIWRRCTPYLHRDDLVSKLPIPQVSVFLFGRFPCSSFLRLSLGSPCSSLSPLSREGCLSLRSSKIRRRLTVSSINTVSGSVEYRWVVQNYIAQIALLV
jgi:hypothetical protein